MSRSESRLISSQTSNWISTSTEPCSALFWALFCATFWVTTAAGADDATGVRTTAEAGKVELAVSIRFSFASVLQRISYDRSAAIRGVTGTKSRDEEAKCLCLLSQKEDKMGSGFTNYLLIKHLHGSENKICWQEPFDFSIPSSGQG